MSVSQLFRRILIPCAAGVTISGGHTYGPNCVKRGENGTKPSDLPLYAKPCSECGDSKTETAPPCSTMEETVGNIRRELWVWQDSLRGYRHKIVDVYRKGFSKADSVVDYLRQEPHGPQRAGAIAISGLAGYVLGMRKGVFRRVLYGCCGALGMAAICYPNEAKDTLEAVVLEARRCFIVAYHFIYGETPKIPEWLEKLTGITNPPEEKPKPITNKESNLDVMKIMGIEENKEKKA